MTNTDKHLDKETLELLTFHVCGQDYSVDIMSVREIRGSAKATTLPHAPSYVKGVINLRGTVLPIIDLSARLQLETDPKKERNVIIVVKIEGRTAGLMVDAVSDILAVDTDQIQPPPDLSSDTENSYISALTIVDNKMIRILDLSSIMPPQGEEAA